jgi:uncharacterized protein (TIGR00369 family)
MSTSSTENTRVSLLKQMKGVSPEYWPYPIPKFLGMEILEVEEGYAKVKVVVKKDWLNPSGIAHGGILITLMDEMMGLCAYTLNMPTPYSTINLTADFFKSAAAEAILIAEGKIVKAGRQIINAESIVWNEDGKIVCKSGSNLLSINKKA